MYMREKDLESMRRWRECICDGQMQEIISRACEVLMNDCLNDVRIVLE